MAKRGRKKWKPDYPMIEKWAMQGLADKEIAHMCGVSPQVFCSKKNELPELEVALGTGRAKGTIAASGKLWILINNGDRDAIKFYLARRANWSETTVIDTPHKPLEEMTEEELKAIAYGSGNRS